MANKRFTGKRLAKRRNSTSAGRTLPAKTPKKTTSKKLARRKPKRDKRGRLLPGSTANPNGRPPKDVCITTLVKEILGETLNDRTKKTYADSVAKAIVLGAIALDRTALKELLQRVDGPVEQKVAIEDKVKQVLEFVIAPRPKKKARQKGKGE